MIVLTHKLARLRTQARTTFPDAEWLPGDECPVGARVLRGPEDNPATVLGVVQRPEGDPYEFWWLLRDDRYPEHEVLDWPPLLRSAAVDRGVRA